MLTNSQISTIVNDIQYKDWWFVTHPLEFGLLVQACWFAPSADDGAVKEQHGRKWYVSPHACKSEIIQTVLKAVLTAEEHEAREAFAYRGKHIFGPHIDVEVLADICAKTESRKASG